MWDKQISSLIILECAVILRHPLYGKARIKMLNLLLIFLFSFGVGEEGYKVSASNSVMSLPPPVKEMNTINCMMIFK